MVYNGLKISKGDAIGGFGILYIKEMLPIVYGDTKIRVALFKCYCGKKFKANISALVSSNTKSCGCRRDKVSGIRFFKHGLRYHEIYETWLNMRSRCFNKNHKQYHRYGGRGISISEEFNDFVVFMEYVTSLPRYKSRKRLKLSLDRVENNGNYERNNLRWATRKQQRENRADNLFVLINNNMVRLKEAAKITGIHRQTLRYRLISGWGSEEIVNTPIGCRRININKS